MTDIVVYLKKHEKLHIGQLNTLIRCLEQINDYESLKIYESYLPTLDIEVKSAEDVEGLDNSKDSNGIIPLKRHKEGGKKELTVSIYERNNYARKLCILYHKAECYICKFNFAQLQSRSAIS